MQKKMKVITVVNQKGGVGKTVTSVNLAIGLANKGKKVLAIDLDPQGSMSLSLGIKDTDKLEFTISEVLRKTATATSTEFNFNEAIIKHEENIDFIASNLTLTVLENDLMQTLAREYVLKKFVSSLNDIYDYIIIDCSPSLNLLTINALACCDEVIIPVQAQYLPVKGMEQLFFTIANIKQQVNKALHIKGILITMLDCRSNYTKEIVDLLDNSYGKDVNIFKSQIPMSVRASEISLFGKSIYQHDPKGKVAKAYKSLVDEVLASDGEVL